MDELKEEIMWNLRNMEDFIYHFENKELRRKMFEMDSAELGDLLKQYMKEIF